MTRLCRITTDRIHFLNLIHSHGWRALAPFTWDETTRSLSRPLLLSSGKTIHATITARPSKSQTIVEIRINRTLHPKELSDLKHQVRRMLNLDEDLAEFHNRCRQDPLLKFVHRTRSGRMLRSPAAFEDLIKTICTTNCSWQNTRKMCEKLCLLNHGNFPVPEVLAKIPPKKLARLVPVGYRARTIRQASRLMLAGKLPLDEWASTRRFDEIRSALKSIWGIGPYAQEHMLMLLGDYSTIPVDSEVLKYLRATHFEGQKVSMTQAVKPYAKYKQFQFLAFRFARMAHKK